MMRSRFLTAQGMYGLEDDGAVVNWYDMILFSSAFWL